MTEPTAASPQFDWIHKRDGRLVPFDADKISQALFAAGESLGRSDAFTARELTDSIVHFLAADCDGAVPSTAQVAELVVKVVRELGQPALARAFAEGRKRPQERQPTAADPATALPTGTGPSLPQLARWIDDLPSPGDLAGRAAGVCLRDYTLREVFARDLVAAQADGLLTLTGLEAPLELAGAVLPDVPVTAGTLVEAVEALREIVGDFLAVDGPEHLLARLGVDAEGVAAFTRALRLGLRVARLRAVINLNSAMPPARAEDLAVGPLFAGHRQPAEPETRGKLLEALQEELLQPSSAADAVRVDWHLGAHDFGPTIAPPLLRLARRALEGGALAFVCDRPRRPVPLAEGVDRRHPAVLLSVGLHLPRLVEQSGPRVDPDTFLQKLGSLARLALSAAKQKREFLRRHSHGRPALTGGFLLERARLNVVPFGLEAAVQALTGSGPCSGGAAAELALRAVRRLREVLREDGRACLLDTCLDALPARTSVEPEAGLTAWSPAAPARNQLRAASPWHAAAEAGTATVFLAADPPPTAEDVVELLRYAWQQTDVVRVRFARPGRPPRQLTAPWENGGPPLGETRPGNGP